MLCVVVLAGLLVFNAYQHFRHAEAGSEALATFRGVLDLANAVAAERGPANAAMAGQAGDAHAAA
ncbi:hypothetical protein ACFQ4O_18050, partial [Methylopila musalis]